MTEQKSISQAKRHPPHPLVQSVLVPTGMAAGAGAFTGACLATWRGKGALALAYAFGMSSNWTLFAAPVLALRLGLLSSWSWAQPPRLETPPSPLTEIHSTSPAAQMQLPWKAHLASSAMSAGLIGGSLLCWWRGRTSGVIGGLVYAGLGATLESLFISFHSWRLDWTLNRRRMMILSDGQPPPAKSEAGILDLKWWRRPADNFDQRPITPVRLDPLQDAFLFCRSKLVDWFGFGKVEFSRNVSSIPSWISPLANALDVEYRDRLDKRIVFVESQIKILEHEIARRKATDS